MPKAEVRIGVKPNVSAQKKTNKVKKEQLFLVKAL